MYQTVLTLHSWNRWLALVLAVAATINAFLRTPHIIDGRPRGSKWDTCFMAAVDLQVLLGLLLYFGLSPYSTEAMNNPSGAMKSASLRFWGFEHEILAFGSMAAVRLGRIFATRGSATPETRQRRRIICFAAALVTMLAAAFAERRPWFRAWPG
ncbi:MAG: hypothetical protein FJW27_09820 [Acidimicrobiia bacterium]|nr:hypothetical protein [Acidimicrobiia bacterium]